MNLKKVYAKMKQFHKIQQSLLKANVFFKQNDFTGQYGEFLACEQLKLEQASKNMHTNSGEQKGYDAIDEDDKKYQIKARCNTANQFETSTSPKKCNFDFLIFIMFEKDYHVKYAYLISKKNLKQYERNKNDRITYKLSKAKLNKSGEDITEKLNKGL